jgi:hypothetical protein
MLLSLFIIATLNARENPFFAAKGEKDVPYTSNETRDKTPLKRAAISLPSEARLLQKVTLEYKNLDGSIDKKSIELDNSVDWHLPVFISQSYNEEKNIIKIPKKRVSKNRTKYNEIASTKYVKFYSSDKKLKLKTSDKILRSFLLVNPHRIVLDFKRDSNMKSYSKNIPKNIFTKVRVGNHDGYYRVVVELDGLYRYTLNDISNGYILELE